MQRPKVLGNNNVIRFLVRGAFFSARFPDLAVALGPITSASKACKDLPKVLAEAFEMSSAWDVPCGRFACEKFCQLVVKNDML